MVNLRPRTSRSCNEAYAPEKQNLKKRKTGPSKKQRDARKEKEREKARKKRERIKKDPVKYEAEKQRERERWERRRKAGLVKLVGDMDDREKRLVRKRRRESVEKYRKKMKLIENEELIVPTEERNTPEGSIAASLPSSNGVGSLVTLHPVVTSEKTPNDGRKITGRKKVKRDKCKVYRQNKKLNEKLKTAQRGYWRILKSNQRLRAKFRLTPRSKVRKELKGRRVDPAVRRKLVFHEVLTEQIAETATKASGKSKQAFYKMMSGKILKRYKMLKYTKSFLSMKLLCKYQKKWNKKSDPLAYERNKSEDTKTLSRSREVIEFYHRDEVSAKCPDKKAYIINYKNGKVKKRKRILQGTLLDLYTEYVKSVAVDRALSYSVFCKLKPFYIVKQKASERDTCLCKACENFELKVLCLNRLKVIKEASKYQVLSSITCEESNDDCLRRICTKCSDKSLKFSSKVCDKTQLTYYLWANDDEGKLKKIPKNTTLKEFLKEFLNHLELYMQHHFRCRHQLDICRNKRENLEEGEFYLHFDFSENYGCKYSREIQPMYYGGNREELTLHSGILYTKTMKQAFLTISQDKRKDPPAIWAHLFKVLDKFIPMFPGTTKIHLQSDSPVTQYRNKDYFHLATTLLPSKLPQVTEIVHNYTEAGHGKGGPDGVGGWAKSQTDQEVGNGKDIATFEDVVTFLKKRSKKTFIETVSTAEIEEMDNYLCKDVQTFVGTMKVHQLTWNKEKSSKLYFNEVSCYQCRPGTLCQHFNLPNSPWTLPGAREDSSDEDEPTESTAPAKKGDWIAAAYGKHWYPGYVEKASAKTLRVNFMVKHPKKRDLFLWPANPDVQDVKRDDVLCIFTQPPVAQDRCHFTIAEGSKVKI